MEAWRRVEVAACEEMDGPSEAELEAIRAATFTVQAVQRREEVTDHDVAAFVDVLAESAGPAGRWIHYGLTSSDVLDTALALQLQAAGSIVVDGARALASALRTSTKAATSWSVTASRSRTASTVNRAARIASSSSSVGPSIASQAATSTRRQASIRASSVQRLPISGRV